MRFLAAVLLIFSGFAAVEAAEATLPRTQFKNGTEVRAAFQEVVASASRATVRVVCDGRVASLGTVIDSDGGVLTKASQLSGKITCRFQDGREIDAHLIGIEDKLDLAYLKVETTGLSVVEWERKAIPDVGQFLATAGLEEAPIAVGVVSVQRRRLPEQKGMLGVTSEDNENGTPGARVLKILSGSGADKAGLKVGDVICRVGGDEVAGLDEMADAVGRHEPGETIDLQVMRGAEKLSVRATLGHPTPDLLTRGGFMNHLGGRLSRRRTGFPPVLQHDTVLMPEECGGPVVTLSGKVVGINIARAGRTETYALLAETILPVLSDLKSGRLAPHIENSAMEAGPAPPPLPEN